MQGDITYISWVATFGFAILFVTFLLVLDIALKMKGAEVTKSEQHKPKKVSFYEGVYMLRDTGNSVNCLVNDLESTYGIIIDAGECLGWVSFQSGWNERTKRIFRPVSEQEMTKDYYPITKPESVS